MNAIYLSPLDIASQSEIIVVDESMMRMQQKEKKKRAEDGKRYSKTGGYYPSPHSFLFLPMTLFHHHFSLDETNCSMLHAPSSLSLIHSPTEPKATYYSQI